MIANPLYIADLDTDTWDATFLSNLGGDGDELQELLSVRPMSLQADTLF